VGVVVWLFYREAKKFTDEKYQAELLEVLGKAWEDNQQEYVRQLTQTLDKIYPPVADAFQKQAKKDMPKILAFVEKEREPFLNSLSNQFEKRLEKQYDKLRPRYVKVLSDEFPQAKNKDVQDRMMNNIDKAITKLIKKYYGDELRDQLVLTFDTWDHFPHAAPPGPKDMSLEDQLLDSIYSVVSYSFLKGPR
jgi:hypothetical protein